MSNRSTSLRGGYVDGDHAMHRRRILRGHRLGDDRLGLAVEEIVEVSVRDPVAIGCHQHVAEGEDARLRKRPLQTIRHLDVARQRHDRDTDADPDRRVPGSSSMPRSTTLRVGRRRRRRRRSAPAAGPRIAPDGQLARRPRPGTGSRAARPRPLHARTASACARRPGPGLGRSCVRPFWAGGLIR